MKSIFLGTAFVGLLLALSTSHAGQFYKWTDDNGVVHYSQQPPQGKTSEPVQTRNTKGSSTAAERNTETPKSDSQPTAKTSEPIKKIKKDPELCQQAKKDAQVLRQRPIVRRNNKVMTIEEKNKALANLETIIKQNC